MKLVIIWECNDSKKFEKELNEIKSMYELGDILTIERRSSDKEYLKVPTLVLEEPEIDFKEILIEEKVLSKDESKDLIEQLFWITNSWCSTSSCSSCSSGCN